MTADAERPADVEAAVADAHRREWGFVLAKAAPFEIPKTLRIGGLRWLDDATLPTLFVLGADADEVPVEANHLNNQALVHYYEREWRKWN